MEPTLKVIVCPVRYLLRDRNTINLLSFKLQEFKKGLSLDYKESYD